MPIVNEKRIRTLQDTTLHEMLMDGFASSHDVQSRMALTGVLVVKDAHGHVIARKKNLVVLRGRVFALEKIFGITAGTITDSGGPEGDYIANLNRQVCLFSLGSGGAPAETPFVPSAPSALDSGCTTPIALRTWKPAVDGGTKLDWDPNDVYHQSDHGISEVDPSDGNVYNFDLKRINTADDTYVPIWVYDNEIIGAANTAAVKMSLEVEPDDADNQQFNEIAVHFAANTDVEWSTTTARFTDIEPLTHLTFATEPNQLKMDLTFEYYVFA